MKKLSLVLVGIFLSLVCLELVLQTTSFIIAEVVKYKNHKILQTKLNNNDTITILCAGESTTYEQWPVQLEQYLKDNSNKNFNIVTSALPSIDIENLLERTFRMVGEFKPDIVISMMGVNNSSFEKEKNQIYNKHILKTIDLFYLIKKHFQTKEIFFFYGQPYNDLYLLELVNKYKNNTEAPVEFFKILNEQPNNMNALVELIYLYHERHDIENIKKHIDIFIEKYPEIIDNKVFVTALSNYKTNSRNDFNKILLHLIKNKDKTTKKDINEIFKNSISYRYKYIELEELEYIYDLLLNNKIDATIVIDIYNYLSENNIEVKYPEYDITFSKEPNFDTEQIKNAYIELAKFLQKRNIVYICMGYPTLNINIFENMFNGTNLKENIIFVSNEQNFNNYLKDNEFSSVFTDQFAGTFGHCNDLGNTMIAENVGKVIINLTNKN